MPGMLLLISKKEEKKMVKIKRRDTEKTRLAIKVLERERGSVMGPIISRKLMRL